MHGRVFEESGMINKTCPNISLDKETIDKYPWKIVVIIVMSSIPFITIAGNILVIYTVAKLHRFRQKANVFVVSLAVTDIAVAIFVMSFSILKQFGDMPWLTFRSVCWLSFSLDVMFTSSSILHLMCMTVDRYIAICLPFKYHSIMNQKAVTALIILCWTLPVLLSFALIFNEVHIIGIESHITCTHMCTVLVNIYYAVICSMVAFYVPSIFMLVCNLKIFWEVRQKGRQLCELIQSIQRQQHSKLLNREVKVARTIAIMLSCFFLCWLPFFILNIVDPIIRYKTDQITWLIIIWLGYINSTINPYLYYFLNKPAKAGCCKSLGRSCCLKGLLDKKGNVYVVQNLTAIHNGTSSFLDNTVA